ncbi:MAG TPA: hypothetical protein GX697_01255, partial [Firmicutes bacterium]|nr:hypothetical protein [Bacillota bacterium]
QITSIMTEAGGTLNYALLEAGLADKLYCFIAPVIFGGRTAPTSFGGEGIAAIANAWRLRKTRVIRVGEDILVTGYFKERGTS